MFVQNLQDQYSMEKQTLMPSAGLETRPYELIQTTRQPAKHQQAVSRLTYYSQVKPDLQGMLLEPVTERLKLPKYNGKSYVGEFIANFLNIVENNQWSDSHALL